MPSENSQENETPLALIQPSDWKQLFEESIHVQLICPEKETLAGLDPGTAWSAVQHWTDRNYAYFDETYRFYLLLKTKQPDDALFTRIASVVDSEFLWKELIKRLDIQVIASIENESSFQLARSSSLDIKVLTSDPIEPIRPPSRQGSPLPPSNETSSSLSIPSIAMPAPAAHSLAARGRPNPSLSSLDNKLSQRSSRSRNPSIKNQGSSLARYPPTTASSLKDLDSSDIPAVEESQGLADDDILFWYKYDRKSTFAAPLFFHQVALVPLQVPIASHVVLPLQLSAVLTFKPSALMHSHAASGGPYCDHEDFDATNLFEGLAQDPYFNPESVPVHRMSHQYRRQSLHPTTPSQKLIKKLVHVHPAVMVDVAFASVSSEHVLMAVSVENGLLDKTTKPPFHISDINVEMENAVVKMCFNALPCVLQCMEKTSFLFKVTFLDDPLRTFGTESVASLRSICVSVKGKVESQPSITSKWYASVDLSQIQARRWHIQPQLGYSKEWVSLVRKVDLDEVSIRDSGVTVTFSVSGCVYLCKIFSIQVFLVNRTDKTKHYKISVPSKYRSDPLQPTLNKLGTDKQTVPVYMEHQDFMHRFNDFEKMEASIVCLEGDICPSPLRAHSCQTLNLHFIPIKSHLHTIERIDLTDLDTMQTIEIKNVLQVYVHYL